MRLTFASVSLILATALSGCSYGNDANTAPGPVCLEQSAMAQSGKVGGGEIIITCPPGDYQ